MAIYFTADTHFSLVDYNGVILRDYRPFKTLKQMSLKIIKIWNKQANKNDIIYHLGDFVNYNCKDNKGYLECFKLVKKIKAQVVLVLGNNEERLIDKEFSGDFVKFRQFLLGIGFKDVVKDMKMTIGETKFYLNHYPIKHKKNVLNLFGHIHGTCFVKRYGFNVGIDNHNFGLFSEKDICELVGRMPLYDENVFD